MLCYDYIYDMHPSDITMTSKRMKVSFQRGQRVRIHVYDSKNICMWEWEYMCMNVWPEWIMSCTATHSHVMQLLHYTNTHNNTQSTFVKGQGVCWILATDIYGELGDLRYAHTPKAIKIRDEAEQYPRCGPFKARVLITITSPPPCLLFANFNWNSAKKFVPADPSSALLALDTSAFKRETKQLMGIKMRDWVMP